MLDQADGFSGTSHLTADELLSLARAGYIQLKTETNNNAEILAVLQLINILVMAEQVG